MQNVSMIRLIVRRALQKKNPQRGRIDPPARAMVKGKNINVYMYNDVCTAIRRKTITENNPMINSWYYVISLFSFIIVCDEAPC